MRWQLLVVTVTATALVVAAAVAFAFCIAQQIAEHLVIVDADDFEVGMFEGLGVVNDAMDELARSDDVRHQIQVGGFYFFVAYLRNRMEKLKTK